MRTIVITLALGLGATACSKPEPAPPPPPEPTVGAEAPEISIEGVAWSDMDHDQKGKYMAEVVTPAMKAMFAEFDPEEAEGFGCKTCHGDNAEEVGFEMPNGLHPLDTEAFPTPASPDPEVARWASFMFNQVTPKMVELLGEEPYDPETQQGFGCFGCHAMVE